MAQSARSRVTTTKDIERALAKIPRCDPDALPPVPRSTDAPLSLGSMGPLSPDAFGTLPALDEDRIERMRREEEAQAREAWDARFDLARASLPEKFAWVPTLRPPFDVLGSTFATALPWFRAHHAARLLAAWKSPKNILLCGDVGAGKTTLLILFARWTLAAAGYDAPAIRKRRDEIAAERNMKRDPSTRYQHVLPEPEHLSQVRAAQHSRFVSVPSLLDAKGLQPDEAAVESAKRASVLFLDEIGKELVDAQPGSYLASSRAPALMRVIEHFWNAPKRWFGTTMYRPETLASMYDLGTFRRLVEDESGAVAIDLDAPDWAGVYLKEKAARARAERSRR